MNAENTPKLELAEMIKCLRAELTKARDEGGDKDIRFTVQDVELEVDIAVETQDETGITAKFYVLTGKLKQTEKDMLRQKLKIRLTASDATKNGPLEISDDDTI